MRTAQRTYTRIILAITICLLIGFLGAMATASSVSSWYTTLNKPFFTPPNWLFGPVWTLLYVMMGWAAGLIWSRGFHHLWVKSALYAFGIQLLLNGSWSIVFFGLRSPVWALVIIVLLAIMIIVTIRQFRVVNKTAAWLLAPYLAWVAFASALNLAIVLLN
ncbi:TspO and MBR related proteins [Robiginitalea myxolifaciens]|uniref:TspO and MBR related proteins n=1 Tax=Robiginitalea myxolifaciens TaxID=400055 RepID=A0A1I6G9S5_9FLAO|nr:TspO/MBR family protein [Robiginitalea myxolifaciens]SFR38956.1 TspO and MBR related proteins [Robiginitalea myxolifaciens]